MRIIHIDFVLHLREYCTKGELVPSNKNFNFSYPVLNLIVKNLPDIEIHFMHYQSISEAKSKWYSRSARIDYENIYLLIELREEQQRQILDLYKDLPYKKTIFNPWIDDGNELVKLSFYLKHPKKLSTSFVNLNGKRCYDEFDFANAIFRE